MKIEHLTLQEQKELIDDLVLFQAVILAYTEYCKSIGKEKESKKFVQQFLDDVREKEA